MNVYLGPETKLPMECMIHMAFVGFYSTDRKKVWIVKNRYDGESNVWVSAAKARNYVRKVLKPIDTHFYKMFKSTTS